MGIYCLLSFLIQQDVVTTLWSTRTWRGIQGENPMQKRYRTLAIAYISLNMFIPNIVVMLRLAPTGEPRVGKKNGGNPSWPRQGNLTQRDEPSSIKKW